MPFVRAIVPSPLNTNGYRVFLPPPPLENNTFLFDDCFLPPLFYPAIISFISWSVVSCCHRRVQSLPAGPCIRILRPAERSFRDSPIELIVQSS